MTPFALTQAVREAAAELGFGPMGVCPAQEPPTYARFLQWLEAGYGGSMRYLSQRRDAYQHPASILQGVTSIVMLAFAYQTQAAASVPGEVERGVEVGHGQVSRYAWGAEDYHDLIHGRLKELERRLGRWAPRAVARGVVDTAPLLERDFARLAGMGWVGKHTLLIHPQAGSWFFLAALLTDATLVYDEPFAADHCGTCRACLDACPTEAFPQPYVLDATKCISYLTIELRDAIPSELREACGDRVFGCDICQQVCPWNRHAPLTAAAGLQPRDDLHPLELTALFELDDAAFRERFRATSLWRARRRGLLRNAAVVLGNQRYIPAIPALSQGLCDAEPLVRGACAWALGQIAAKAARGALVARQPSESDPQVRAEIASALAR